MTRLARKVRRVAGDGRDSFVVILHPDDGAMGASIELREKGRRKGYRIELSRLYTRLAMQEAGFSGKRSKVRSK
jgi:hypothetical protein